jgi:nitrite reductase (NO-forming)
VKKVFALLSVLIIVALLLSGCGAANRTPLRARSSGNQTGRVVEYSLMTGMVNGQFAFIGVGGGIDGVQNPTLSANLGDTVRITLTNGDGVEHNISFPDFNAQAPNVATKGSSTQVEFTVDKGGSFSYFCAIPGHKEAGMHGTLEVTGGTANTAPTSAPGNSAAAGPVVVKNPPTTGADIVRDPTEIPPPIGARGPQTVRIDLEAVEIEGQLADGATYTYWTFSGKVPGPFFRVKVGDTLEVHLKNLAQSTMSHSVDFHGRADRSEAAQGKSWRNGADLLRRGRPEFHLVLPRDRGNL